MSAEDYLKAYKAGKKEYQARIMKGQRPTLAVLEDILPPKSEYSEMPLGLIQIPVNQIVGTRSWGRSNAFAANFMPVLKPGSEFSGKWAKLSTSHEEEGIREPIKAYEYMNKFYVEEGNKRVSVMKFFGADSIPGEVTRMIPRRTADKENQIYYEFLDFYELSKVNDIWFSKKGSFRKLQMAVKGEPDAHWTEDDKLTYSSNYARFLAEYRAKGGEKLGITPGDAFLAFLALFDYDSLREMTTSRLKELIAKSWKEFELLEDHGKVALKMDPANEKTPLLNRLLSIGPKRLKIAFVYEKTPTSSAWTYSHELGRLHLEQTFPEEVQTVCFENVTPGIIDDVLKTAVAEGCNIVFTTTPVFAQASVKAAIAWPQVRFLNCSLNTSHRYIRTYYARMHEAKFLMGAIAGALAENDRIMYMEDYPIYGSIANINAFALGAKMINPRVKVYLEWTSAKNMDIHRKIGEISPSCISGKDMVIPEEELRLFGVYRIQDGRPQNIAMPLCHWGKFYERLIRTIMDGTWKLEEEKEGTKAINYWWGMSSDVVEVAFSKNLPAGTKRLINLLEHTIRTGEFSVFGGVLYGQNHKIYGEADKTLSPEQIAKMDWLAENVIGDIPSDWELQDTAKPILQQQGVKAAKEGQQEDEDTGNCG